MNVLNSTVKKKGLKMIVCSNCKAQITKGEEVKYDLGKNELYFNCFNCQNKITIYDFNQIVDTKADLKTIQDDIQKLIENLKNCETKKKGKYK